MPDLSVYLAFIAAVLAYQLSGPGPDMLLVISRGVAQGWRSALTTAVGCVAAGAIQIPLLAFGLASLVASSPIVYETLRWAGAGYLFYLGWKLVFAGGSSKGAPGATHRVPARTAFWQGMICNLTNPTTLAFMLAMLPQFVHPSAGSPALQFLILGTTMKASGLLVLGSTAIASGALGQWLSRHATFFVWQQRFAGAVMIALGLRLVLLGDVRAVRS
jgi:threonine/homoserine/homoserine lactone efflux protein